MKLARFARDGRVGLALAKSEHDFRGRFVDERTGVEDLRAALTAGAEAVAQLSDWVLGGTAMDLDAVTVLPPLPNPEKVICIGLNYVDHSAEAGSEVPDYPAVFSRFNSSLIGHRQPILRPAVSEQLDYEGEIAVVLGRGGRHIDRASALDHVFGYAIFNDASVRDYQIRSPQWTMGKNFDATGAFGPYIVTADELPAGATGLRLETRLNETVVQSANTNDLVFDVETLIVLLSEVMTLAPGDVIVSGTPAGVGAARKPPLWMKDGDTCTITVPGLGSLVNPVADA